MCTRENRENKHARYFLHARTKAAEALGYPLDALLEADGVMLATLEQTIKVGDG